MADKSGDRKGAKRTLTFFFLNGKLYKRLRINRPADTIEVWCYLDERRVVLTYSEVRKNYEPAFSTAEVAEMLGKNSRVVERYARSGNIPEPTMAYSLTKKMYRDSYKWSGEDIMNLHGYLLTVHRGRPRTDGKITPAQMPNAKELRALIHQENVLYVRNKDGQFVPTWRA